MTARSSRGAIFVWGLVALLIVLHQDNWFWTDRTLVFGFLPIGLFYHACLSVAAAATWFLATKFAWPEEVIAEAYRAPADRPGGGESPGDHRREGSAP